jgi:hypothetical protein
MRLIADVLAEVINLMRVEVVAEARREDVELRSYEWLLREIADPRSTHAQVIRNHRFHPGKIHVFQYDPKHKSTMDYYDTHPVMLHLGTIRRGESVLELGVNLTWYPPPARRYLVGRVREIYQERYDSAQYSHPNRALDQHRVLLDVYKLRHFLDHMGFSFGIRQYIPRRVVSERVVVDYESWERMVALDHPRVFPALHGKMSIGAIYQEFFKHVRLVNQDRGARIRRIDEQRESQSLYRFIDR